MCIYCFIFTIPIWVTPKAPGPCPFCSSGGQVLANASRDGFMVSLGLESQTASLSLSIGCLEVLYVKQTIF